MFRTGANASRSGLRLRAIHRGGAGNQTSNSFAVSCDHSCFTLLHAVQQRADGILGFESTRFPAMRPP